MLYVSIDYPMQILLVSFELFPPEGINSKYSSAKKKTYKNIPTSLKWFVLEIR